jgi:hypothetical protein
MTQGEQIDHLRAQMDVVLEEAAAIQDSRKKIENVRSSLDGLLRKLMREGALDLPAVIQSKSGGAVFVAFQEYQDTEDGPIKERLDLSPIILL